MSIISYFDFRQILKMSAAYTIRKGMNRILDGIMQYRQKLRPSLLEEFKKVALGPSVR